MGQSCGWEPSLKLERASPRLIRLPHAKLQHSSIISIVEQGYQKHYITISTENPAPTSPYRKSLNPRLLLEIPREVEANTASFVGKFVPSQSFAEVFRPQRSRILFLGFGCSVVGVVLLFGSSIHSFVCPPDYD